jgi:hypothetical protein
LGAEKKIKYVKEWLDGNSSLRDILVNNVDKTKNRQQKQINL